MYKFEQCLFGRPSNSDLYEPQMISSLSVAELRRLELKAVFDNAPIAIWIAHDHYCQKITGNNYANERIMKVPADSNISASVLPGTQLYSKID